MSTSTPGASAPAVFSFQSHEVRTVERDGQVWFVATDVCAALDIENNRNATARLDDDEKDVRTMDTPSGQQEMTVINESGLYSLILGSRKAEAKKFKKWVTSEVLPAIRKTGRYESDTITAAQAGELATRIAEKFPEGRHRPYAWSRFNNHFRLSGYKTLPAAKFAEACAYIDQMEGKDTKPALPAPATISPALRAHITRTAHEIALKQYDTILAILTECARDNLACGASEADCFGYVSRYASVADGTALANIRDLQELVNCVGHVVDGAAQAVATIKRIEKRSGYQLYSRIQRAEWQNPDFHKNDRLIQEVIDRIAGDDHE